MTGFDLGLAAELARLQGRDPLRVVGLLRAATPALAVLNDDGEGAEEEEGDADG